MFTSNFFSELAIDSSDIPYNSFIDLEELACNIKLSLDTQKPFIIDLDNNEDIQDHSHYREGIYIIYRKKITYISWELFYYYNYYFYGLLKRTSITFSLENCWYNIFYILTYFKNRDSYRNDAKLSIVSGKGYPAVFSIYDSYNYKIGQCVFSYYFSYPIGKFILASCQKKVIDNRYYIIGELLPNLEHNSESSSIHVLDPSNTIIDAFNCPQTFKKITNAIYGIFLKEQSPIVFKDIPKNSLSYQYDRTVKQFSRNCGISNTLCFKINRNIEPEDATNIFKYVVKTIPKLNKYSKSFKIEYVGPNLIAITLDISLYYMLPNIINIVEFSLSNKTGDLPILYSDSSNTTKPTIHIVSELYILFAVAVLYIPRMLYYCYPRENNGNKGHSHMHLVFTKEEMAKLANQQESHGFNLLGDYLKIVIAKCLSIFIENHMIIYIEDRSIDYFPIYPNMDNGYLTALVDKNKKSKLSKALITSFIEKLLDKKRGYTLPLVLVNLYQIPTTETIELSKVSIDCRESEFPIAIAIYYNKDHMVISISFSREMRKIKYIFNEFIEELLR